MHPARRPFHSGSLGVACFLERIAWLLELHAELLHLVTALELGIQLQGPGERGGGLAHLTLGGGYNRCMQLDLGILGRRLDRRLK